MKFLIISDSHGSTANLREVLSRRRGMDDALLFLGDGCKDIDVVSDSLSNIAVFAVSGNCDFSDFLSPQKRESELLLTFEGAKILLMHGHRFGITAGSASRAVDYARQKGADILLFGHTHVKEEKYLPPENEDEKPMWIFNPGSISRPRDGSASFGTLEIKDGKAIFGHGLI